MRSNNYAVLEGCYAQAKAVLEEFEIYFHKSGFSLIRLSLGEMRMAKENGTYLSFYFGHDYHRGLSAAPLQEIASWKKDGPRKSLQQVVREVPPHTALRDLVKEQRSKGLNTTQAFKAIFDIYFGEVDELI